MLCGGCTLIFTSGPTAPLAVLCANFGVGMSLGARLQKQRLVVCHVLGLIAHRSHVASGPEAHPHGRTVEPEATPGSSPGYRIASSRWRLLPLAACLGRLRLCGQLGGVCLTNRRAGLCAGRGARPLLWGMPLFATIAASKPRSQTWRPLAPPFGCGSKMARPNPACNTSRWSGSMKHGSRMAKRSTCRSASSCTGCHSTWCRRTTTQPFFMI